MHRDLKPANVKVTPDGRVKVLDFGLAKVYLDDDLAASGASAALSQSPTLAQNATGAGVIMGTAAYISPEQARSKPVDKRADICAFGVLHFEMLTGKALFSGETVSDVLAAVLTRELDCKELDPRTPRSLRRLLRRALRRDPRERLRDIGDARVELAESDPEDAEPASTSQESRAPEAPPELARHGRRDTPSGSRGRRLRYARRRAAARARERRSVVGSSGAFRDSAPRGNLPDRPPRAVSRRKHVGLQCPGI